MRLQDLPDAPVRLADRATAARQQPERKGWRSTVVALVQEEDLTGPELQRRMREEHGAELAVNTLQRWAREARLTAPPPSIESVADRALRLTSSEIRRLERQPAAKLDLDRLQKATQILKTLQGLKPRKATKDGPRTLEDLSEVPNV